MCRGPVCEQFLACRDFRRSHFKVRALLKMPGNTLNAADLDSIKEVMLTMKSEFLCGQSPMAFSDRRAFAMLFLAVLVAGKVHGAEIRWSGYGNAHIMDMFDQPRFSDTPGGVPAGGKLKQDLNEAFGQLREFSLFLDVPLSEELLASAEIEFGDNGTAATLTYAYMTYQATDWLKIKAGKILVPFLRYNEQKPNFLQNLMSQPFTAWQLAPVNGIPMTFKGFGWSDVGVQVGLQSTRDFGAFELKLAAINGLGSDDPNALDANYVFFADGTPPQVLVMD